MTVYFEEEGAYQLPFDCRKLAEKVIAEAVDYEQCPYETEVNLLLTMNEEIREMNRQFREIDRATDVLSFPMVDYGTPGDFEFLEEDDSYFHPESGELMLGDIVISKEKVTAQAEEYGHTEEREFAFLVAHSMLHLFGYDHMEGDEGMGFYGYAFEVYAIALILSSFSLPLAVSKLVSARVAKKEYKNAMAIFKGSILFAIGVGLLAALVVFFGADFFADKVMASAPSAYALRVLAPGLFIVAVMGVVRGYFQGLGSMIPTAISQVIEQIVNAIVSILGASYLLKVGAEAAKSKNSPLLEPAYGAAGGTLGAVAGAFVSLLFVLFVLYAYKGVMKRQLKRDHGTSVESYGNIYKVLLFTIAPVIISTSVYNINQILDQVMFSKIMAAQGHAVKDYMALLGIYTGKYNTLINVPLAMASALGVSAIPSLAGAIAVGDRKQIYGKIHHSIRFTMLIAIPSFVGFLMLSSPLMNLLYGDQRKTPAAMLSLGSITVVLYCLSTVQNSILQGLDKMTVPIRNALISLGIHLVAVFVMLVMLKWNIYSIVVGNIVFSLCMCILNAHSIQTAVGYHQEVKRTFLLPTMAAFLMGVVSYLVFKLFDVLIGGRVFPILFALVAAVGVYAVALILIGGLTEEELYAMPKGDMLVKIFRKLHLMKG